MTEFLNAVSEGWLIGSLLGAISVPLLVSFLVRDNHEKANTKLRVWSLTSAILVLSWAVLLIIEATWWFWTSDLVHRVIMYAGGIFGLYWGIFYLVHLRK